MEIAVQTAGKAPVDSGTVTTGLPDGHTAVVGLTLRDGPLAALCNIFCLVLFVAQQMGNKLGQCSREVLGERRTRGKEILPKCHVGPGMTVEMTCNSCHGILLSATDCVSTGV